MRRRRWWAWWLVAAALAVVVAVALRARAPRRRDEARPAQAPLVVAAAEAPRAARMPSLGQPGVAGRRVAGRVTFERQPVEGATVALEISTDWGTLPSISVASGPDGRFDLGAQPAALVLVVAAQPGRLPGTKRIDLRDPTLAPPPDALEIELAPCATTISGMVEDVSGGPIAGAAVTDGVTHAVTDEQGRFTACVPAGPLKLTASAPAYGQRTVDASAPRRKPIRIGLGPEAVIRGRAVRAEDGAPIEGAIVGVRFPFAETVSGADGRFVLDGLPPGSYTFYARAEGRRYRISPSDIIAVTAGGEVPEVVVPLERLMIVRGRVVTGGRPVAAAGVTLRPVSFEYRVTPEIAAITQADGTFVIDSLAPGDCILGVTAHRVLAPAPCRILPDQELVVEVAAKATIRGRALSDGAPVAGARVHAFPSHPRRDAGSAFAESRADGSFELRGVEAGSHSISAESSALGAFSAPLTLEIAEGEVREGLELILDLAGSIAGTVVDGADQPVEGLTVRLSLKAGQDYGSDTTSLAGTFTVRGLSGGGDYTVELSRNREGPPLAPAAGGAFPLIHLADGTSHLVGVRLVVRDDRLSISGRVQRAGGAPMADVEVQVAVPEQGPYGPAVATTISRDDGTFVLEDVAAGRWLVRAMLSGDLRSAMVPDVEAGAKDVLVEVPRGGVIEGTLVGFSSPPQVDAVGGDQPPQHARVTAGRFLFEDLPARSYEVTAIGDGGGDTTVVEVVADRTAHATLTSHGAGRIEGRAVDFATGAPVAGLRCYCRVVPRDPRMLGAGSYGRRWVTADPDGRFTLDAPAGLPLRVACDRTELTVAKPAPVLVAAGASSAVRLLVVTAARGLAERGWLEAGLGGDGPPVVIGVLPGGRAAKAGLAIGDRVVAIDGVPVGELSGEQANILASDRPIGQAATLTVERGGASMTIRVPVVAFPRR